MYSICHSCSRLSSRVAAVLIGDALFSRRRWSSPVTLSHLRGGAFSSRSRLFLFSLLSAYDRFPASAEFSEDDKIRFLCCQNECDPLADNELAFRVPLKVLGVYLPVKRLRVVARMHGIGPRSASLENLQTNCDHHVCDNVCSPLLCVFERCKFSVYGLQSITFDTSGVQLMLPPDDPVEEHAFPPAPLSIERCAELTNE